MSVSSGIHKLQSGILHQVVMFLSDTCLPFIVKQNIVKNLTKSDTYYLSNYEQVQLEHLFISVCYLGPFCED